MNEPHETPSTSSGLTGAAVGGIIGIAIWQILSPNFLQIGFVAGLLILSAYMPLCVLLGMAVERRVSKP